MRRAFALMSHGSGSKRGLHILSLIAPRRMFSSGPSATYNEMMDAYDPELEDTKIKFDQYTRSMRKIERKDEADLLHGDDGGMIYKYDLPVLNMPITFHNKLVKVDEKEERELMTST